MVAFETPVEQTDFTEAGRPYSANRLQSVVTVDEALREAGLDWEVEKIPLRQGLPGGRGWVNVPGRSAIVRTDKEEHDSDRFLGITYDTYEPVQNFDAFSIVQPMMAEHGARITHAGLTHGGSRVWMRLQMPGLFATNGDEYQRELIVWAGHGGDYSIAAAARILRLICLNGLMAMGDVARWKIRHTTGAVERLRQAAEIVMWSEQQYGVLMDQLGLLVGVQPEGGPAEFLKRVIPPKYVSSRTVTKHEHYYGKNVRERVLRRWQDSPALKNHRGDLYGGVQAVAEYTDHDKVPALKPEKQMEGLWWGTTDGLKQKALETALVEVNEQGFRVAKEARGY